MTPPVLHPDILAINCEAEADRIAQRMVEIVGTELRKRGVIIAISGGVDSAVCAALAVRAFGGSKVYGLMLPETDSSSNSLIRGKSVAEQFGFVRYRDVGAFQFLFDAGSVYAVYARLEARL